MTQAAAITDLEWEMESERGRWLRRRFIWFCAITLLLIFLGEILWSDLRSPDWGTRMAARINLAGATINFALYAGAMVYAWRLAVAHARSLLRIAIWLNALAGGISLIYMRVALEIQRDPELPPGALWLITSTLSIGMMHTLAALFLPWTFRESLAPAVSVLVVNLLIAAIDITRGDTGAWAWIVVALTPIVLLPGSLICWWRFSRFRRQFQLRFESAMYHRLAGELAGARRVHESCLPAPRMLGAIRFNFMYEPMRQIGGDLIFVHPRPGGPDDVLNMVLLDVTGHGIAAALTVNRLVGELERLFAENAEILPGEVLERLNHYVCLTLAPHSIFATALCLRVDAARETLEWASGGHPTAYLRGSDGAFVDLESTDLMLGVIDGAAYAPRTQRHPFGPGAALLACTDGAIEVRNLHGQMLGLSGLRRMLLDAAVRPPAWWPGTLLQRVIAHRHGPPVDDTLLAALWRE